MCSAADFVGAAGSSRAGCDARSLPGLLDVAARGAPLGVVLADAEFDSEANHEHIRQRAKIESIFSAVKRKLSSRAPARSLATQIRQALLLGLAYNIYRLRHRFAQRGCQQSLTADFKWITQSLNRLESTLMKKPGGGGGYG